MDNGKNVQTEITEEELRRKIKRVTREIQKVKEEGLKVDMTTTIYKATAVTLDEDLASQIKRKKEVELEEKVELASFEGARRKGERSKDRY